MSKVKEILTFSPLEKLTKGKNLQKDVLAKNPVIAMPDAMEEKKKKMRELSRTRAAMAPALNTNLSNGLG